MSIYRLREVILSFNADVWVPLANNPHVLLKHPPITSGNTYLEFEQRPRGVLHL